MLNKEALVIFKTLTHDRAPVGISWNKSLAPDERLIMGNIFPMLIQHKDYYLSNKHIANRFGFARSTVSRCINDLINKKWIQSKTTTKRVFGEDINLRSIYNMNYKRIAKDTIHALKRDGEDKQADKIQKQLHKINVRFEHPMHNHAQQNCIKKHPTHNHAQTNSVGARKVYNHEYQIASSNSIKNRINNNIHNSINNNSKNSKNLKSNKNDNQDSAVAVVDDDKKHIDTSDSMIPNKKIDSPTKLDSSKENDSPTEVSQRNQLSRENRTYDPNKFNSFKSNKYGIQLPQNKQTYIWQLLHLDFPNLNLNKHVMFSITKWFPYSYKLIRFAVNYTFTQAQRIHILHPLSYIYWTLKHHPVQKGLNNETPYCSYVNRCMNKKNDYIHHIYETANTFEEVAKFNSNFKPYNIVYSPRQEINTYNKCLQDMHTSNDKLHLIAIIKNFVNMHIRASSATGSLIEDTERTDSNCHINRTTKYTYVASKYIEIFKEMEHKGYQGMNAYRYIKNIVDEAIHQGKDTTRKDGTLPF